MLRNLPNTMEANALAVLLASPDYDARLVPFSDVLVTASFELEGRRPYDYPGVGGCWTLLEGYVYQVSLSVVGERRPMMGSLLRLSKGKKQIRWLFESMQLDTPEELTRLLCQCVLLVDAQHRAGYTAPTREPHLIPL